MNLKQLHEFLKESVLKIGIPDISGISAWDVELTEKIQAYLSLLSLWNKTYNLSAITDLKEMLLKHILDSFSIAKYLNGSIKKALDFGTGAGLPGVPLAILYPEIEFLLVDSRQKKILFLNTVKHELGLKNIRPLCVRAEDLVLGEEGQEEKVDCVLARAVSSLEDFVNLTQHLLKPDGYYLAMKGQIPDDEIRHLLAQENRSHWAAEASSVIVPGLDAERSVVIIRH
ncbi:MAG: 16S rRNA (guanine(527)-N(7))-methyltransferase RsmG [Gammaproteobacteria bacterium]